MSSKGDCDCEISQLVVKVFTKLLWILNCDCKSQTYSRTYFPRRSGKKKKKRNGGAGARQRRSAKRAETVRGASSPSPPVPPHRPPTPPQRTTSLMKKGCGMLDKPPPKLPQKQDLGQKSQKTLDPDQAPKRKTTLNPGRLVQRVYLDSKGFSKGFFTGKIQTKRFSKGFFTGKIQTKRFSKGFFT